MYGRPGNLKRRASDSAQVDAETLEAGKRRRVDEDPSRCSSLPEGQVAATKLFRTPQPVPEASSSCFPSPSGGLDPLNAFSSPATYFPGFETQYSASSSTLQQLNHPIQTQPNPGWVRQPSLPGCSDLSEQTMEDVQSTPQQTPQTSGAEQQLPSWGMPPPPQRSNSAPDLRILLNGPVNPIPPALLGRGPVMESSSLAGALVPFKALEGRHLF